MTQILARKLSPVITQPILNEWYKSARKQMKRNPFSRNICMEDLPISWNKDPLSVEESLLREVALEMVPDVADQIHSTITLEMRFGEDNLWYSKKHPNAARAVHKDGSDPYTAVAVANIGPPSTRTIAQLKPVSTPLDTPPPISELTPIPSYSFCDITNVWHAPPPKSPGAHMKVFIRMALFQDGPGPKHAHSNFR